MAPVAILCLAQCTLVGAQRSCNHGVHVPGSLGGVFPECKIRKTSHTLWMKNETGVLLKRYFYVHNIYLVERSGRAEDPPLSNSQSVGTWGCAAYPQVFAKDTHQSPRNH